MKRACEACTKSKVKCIKDEGKDSCQLCSKRGCPCVFQPRRQRHKLPGDKEAKKSLQRKRKPSLNPVSEIPCIETSWLDFCSNPSADEKDLKSTSWLKIPVAEKDLSYFTDTLFESEATLFNHLPFDEGHVADESLEDSNTHYLEKIVSKTVNSFPLDRLFYDFKSNLTVH